MTVIINTMRIEGISIPRPNISLGGRRGGRRERRGGMRDNTGEKQTSSYITTTTTTTSPSPSPSPHLQLTPMGRLRKTKSEMKPNVMPKFNTHSAHDTNLPRNSGGRSFEEEEREEGRRRRSNMRRVY